MSMAERRELWAKLIERWQASGLTQQAYCESESVSYATFKRWRVRLGKEQGLGEAAVCFVPVSVRGKPTPTARRVSALGGGRSLLQGVEVRLASGRSLVLSGALEEAELGRLIRLLEGLPC